MKQLIRLGIIVYTMSPMILEAHAGGHGPTVVANCKKPTDCTKDEVTEAAAKLLPQAMAAAKLDKSWDGVKADKAEMQVLNGRKDWVVSFKNPKETDKAKQTLYFFITPEGFLGGANFTGN